VKQQGRGAGAAVLAEQSEKLFRASQWQLMWWKLRRHKLALVGAAILVLFYFMGIFCEIISPYSPLQKDTKNINAPPMVLRFVDAQGTFHLQPFIYAYTVSRDPETLNWVYRIDTSTMHRVKLFVQGDSYRMWGFIPARIHLFGAGEARMYLLGTDSLGRDMFSRILYGARISLSIGLVGIAVSLVLGIAIGGISGLLGGVVDLVIQRIIEFLRSIPTLPLWMGLSAAIPLKWPPLRIYAIIVVVLSLVGWTDLGRVVRGKFMSLRKEDYVMAARLLNAKSGWIISRHLVPAFASYLIVNLTLSIPGMILGETALSFLGLGLQPPVISWGTLMQSAQNVRTLALYPWQAIPVFLVILTVLAFNFLGDGLRDAADPYST
jgi:peptide/nickel transport system permease protein